jgi:ATP-grasp domain, R2K clade family 3
MQVGWLLHGDVFAEYHDELTAAIRACGHHFVSLNRPRAPYDSDDLHNGYRNAFPSGSCVITHADIDLVLRVRAAACWTPGVFATLPNYFCSHYFTYLQPYLLNGECTFLPFAELVSQKESLFDRFGIDGAIFVRPDSPLKIFTGQTTTYESFVKDVEFMGFYEFPRDSLVVVSSPKMIEHESRFVVVEGKVVAGSKNRVGNEIRLSSPDVDSLRLAQQIAQCGFQPDSAWVMDICRTTDGRYSLLEIGAFSFANLYGCDKRAVVEAVSETAFSAWQKLQTIELPKF